MPILHNPAGHRLACYLLGRILEADERVQITAEQADALVHGTVFRVEGYKTPASEKAQPIEGAAVADEEEPTSAPTRATAKRGGKRAEVTEAPEVETRG